MQHAFVSGVTAPAEYRGDGWWFVVRGQEALVQGDHQAPTIPRVGGPAALGVVPLHPPQYLGVLGELPCYACEVAAEVEPPVGMVFAPVRGLYGRLADTLYAVAGKAVQIVAWDRTHQYCGRCGTKTDYVPGERATRCPACGLMNFPRLSPAVIVRINRGPELLLARGHSFPDAFYSILAGFVEPGESLEEAVRREVVEEVGVTISDLRYYASQPWPFPNSLMLGFTAIYAGGEIRVQEQELADAHWFRWDALPRIPPPPSIARRLIDAFVAEQRGAGGGPLASR